MLAKRERRNTKRSKNGQDFRTGLTTVGGRVGGKKLGGREEKHMHEALLKEVFRGELKTKKREDKRASRIDGHQGKNMH